MKNRLIINAFISVILLCILSILNLENIPNYFFHLILFILVFLFGLKRKNGIFIFLVLVFINSAVYLIVNEKNLFLLIIYYIWNVFLLYSLFKYTFNLYNNKKNLCFKNIKLPSEFEYLVLKYMSGPIKAYNNNAVIIKKDNGFLIQIDTKDKSEDLFIKFTEIKEVKIDIKPYFMSESKKINNGIDISRSYFSGRAHHDYDIIKSSKIIKSYHITIITINEDIKLVSFDEPKILK